MSSEVSASFGMAPYMKKAFENTSGLVPLGRAVLIQPFEPEAQRSIIALPDSVKQNMTMLEQRAVLVQAGDCAWDDEKKPRAQPGDVVLVTKFAGYMAVGPNDSKQYRLVNDRDIFARVEGGK